MACNNAYRWRVKGLIDPPTAVGMTALNKTDLLSEREIHQRVEAVEAHAPNVVPISAQYGSHIDRLKRELARHLTNYVHAAFSIPLSDETLSFLSWLFDSVDVENVNYVADQANVTFEAVSDFADKVLGRVKHYGGTVNHIAQANR